ncbi:hypothetical protein [Methylobacterium sp. 092160098-2]|uniref:hypothetical protein n=1 Tax=Methylobacterium sp. 092160098-2 TaxID=3025129 RepID=UPI0023819E4C|nr:hypothetical protein [Methylobacterium sp. 092160098-2]MDE4914913.1 hypothetical protein [Methylobacterium sp. 092160098-2]
MDQKLRGASGHGAMDENLLGLANPMSTIPIGREDLVGEDRPGAGLSESVRAFVADGGRAQLKAARDAQPLTAPPPASTVPSDGPRSVQRTRYADDPEGDVSEGRKV